MAYSGWITRLRRTVPVALLAMAATSQLSTDALAADRSFASVHGTGARVATTEPLWSARLRVPGEHGAPTLAPARVVRAGRLNTRASPPTTLPDRRNQLFQIQPAQGVVIIFLLAAATATAAAWRRIRVSGPRKSPTAPETGDTARRHQRRERRNSRCADRRKMSEHQRLVRASSDQLAYLGHELRTPVTAVVGMADSLSRADLPPEQRHCVDTILSSCNTLTCVADSFLDFSSIQTGTLVLDSAEFDLRDLVDEVLDMLSYPAQTKGLELAALVDSDVPVALHGDAARLRQVLVNLLGNAVKFTERGHVSLRVSCKRSKRHSASLRFDVCDTGCGVAKSKRSSIFEAFVRGDPPAGQLRSGIGLGLFIAKVLVQKMGGEIGVDGSTDEGSIFWFTARFEKLAHAPRPLPSARAADRELAVLIVDDSPLIRHVLARYAEGYGLRPCAVADGKRALGALRKAAANRYPFGLLFIDADMDGFETMRLIETVREDESLPTPELVMLTRPGVGLDPLIAALLDRFSELTKPLKQRQVAETLHAILDDGRNRQRDTLPQAVSRSQTAKATGDALSSGAAPGRLRILLAEDNPVALEAISHLLRDVGCDVDVATDGNAAIRAARETRYDAIFMDFQMPGLDGCQATRKIRHDDGDAHLTPIIALTAHAPEKIREHCARAGMVDYLIKPVRAKQLLAVLAEHCHPHPPTPPSGAESEACVENPAAIDRLRLLFVEDGQKRLRAMREAADDGNLPAIAGEAHALIGSASMVGAADMSRACQSLEAVALSGNPEAPLSALEEVEAEFERVRTGIDSDQHVDGTTA
jgi:signal transduction histidine kinase/DNA-binding response OmpR family regulator